MKHALRLLKDIKGRDGKVCNGMREFCEFVMKLYEDALAVGVSTPHEVQLHTTLEKTRIEPKP